MTPPGWQSIRTPAEWVEYTLQKVATATITLSSSSECVTPGGTSVPSEPGDRCGETVGRPARSQSGRIFRDANTCRRCWAPRGKGTLCDGCAAKHRAHQNARAARLRAQRPPPTRPLRLTLDGVTRTLTEWALYTGLQRTTIEKRLARGNSVAQALTPGDQSTRNRYARRK